MVREVKQRDKKASAYNDGIAGGMYAQLAGGGKIATEPKDNKGKESYLCKSGLSSECPAQPVKLFRGLGSGHDKTGA